MNTYQHTSRLCKVISKRLQRNQPIPAESEPEERVMFVAEGIKLRVQVPYSLNIGSVPETVVGPGKYTECLITLPSRGYFLT